MSGRKAGDPPVELKKTRWPTADRAAWDSIIAEGDPLDGAGPCAHWSPATQSKCAQSYGFWLGFLSRSGLLDNDVDIAERATPETVGRYAADALGRCTVETVHMRIVELFWVLRAMRPGADWSWLDQIVERLRRRCRSTDLKPRAGVSAADVYRWAHECVF